MAKRLCLDRIDLPLLIPASDKADGKILEVFLDSIIDMWFEKDELDNANYQMWCGTSELRSRYKELNDISAGKSEVEINQDILKEIIRVFKQNLRKSLKKDQLRKVTGKKRPARRGASSQLVAEREKLIERRRK